MIRRYGSVAGLLRDRPLRDADRDYLERAMRVVAPVADLALALPAGRRAQYPAAEGALQTLMGRHAVKESCARLLSALHGLPPTADGQGS
jgi:hypothetical protein